MTCTFKTNENKSIHAGTKEESSDQDAIMDVIKLDKEVVNTKT